MSSPQQESFQSMATVFILQEKTWIERGSGLVRFVFDLRTFALRLVIRPGTNDEFECKLRPRIRSKGPRAYVVRAQADSGTDEHILAVRFEREEDSRSFRRFVEKRDVDHNHTSKAQPKTNPSYPHPRNATYESGKYIDPMTAAVQQQPPYGRHQNRGSGYYGQTGINRSGGYQNPSALAMYNNQHVPGPDPTNPNKGLSSSYFWTCSRCLQMVDCTLSSCHVCGSVRPMTDPNHPMPNPNEYPANYAHHNPHAHSHAHNNPHAHQQSAYYAQQAAQGGGQAQGPSGAQGGHPQILQSIQPQNTSSNKHHQSSTMPSNRHNQSNATHATYGSSSRHHIGSTSHKVPAHGNYGGSGGSGGHAAPPQPKHQAPVLKLTQVNLEKHNKLFPPKRRNVKEVIQVQLEYIRTHQ